MGQAFRITLPRGRRQFQRTHSRALFTCLRGSLGGLQRAHSQQVTSSAVGEGVNMEADGPDCQRSCSGVYWTGRPVWDGMKLRGVASPETIMTQEGLNMMGGGGSGNVEKMERGQIWWLMPITPELWEEKAGGWLEAGILRPAWAA